MKQHQIVLIAGLSLMSAGATCTGRQIAKTVLDVAEMSCVLYHEDVEEEGKLAQICGIAEDLIPEIRKIVFARKSAAKMKADKPLAAPSTSTSASVKP